MKKIFLLAISTAMFLVQSCSTDDALVSGIPTSASVRISTEQAQIYLGESVTFNLDYEAASLAIYTGDQGAEYEYSYYGVIADLDNADILNETYLRPDTTVTPYNFAFEDYTSELFDIVKGDITLSTPESQLGILGSVEQAEGEPAALCVELTDTKGWDNYLRFTLKDESGEVGKVVDSNKELKMRMKFDVGSESKIFQVLATLKGRSEDGEPTIVKYGYYANKLSPSTEYTDYTFDLTSEFASWESKALVTMAYIEEINIIVRDFDDVGWSKFWIESIEFGDNGYFPLSSGYSVSTFEASGVATYEHTYNEVGSYSVVAVAVTNGKRVLDRMTIEVIERDETTGGGSLEDMNSESGSWDEEVEELEQ